MAYQTLTGVFFGTPCINYQISTMHDDDFSVSTSGGNGGGSDFYPGSNPYSQYSSSYSGNAAALYPYSNNSVAGATAGVGSK